MLDNKVKGLAWIDDSVTSRGGDSYYVTAKSYVKVDAGDVPVVSGVLNAMGLGFLKFNIEITAGGLVNVSTESVSDLRIINVSPAVSI